MTLQAIKGVISQELGKIGEEMKTRRNEMCKVLVDLEEKVENKLSKGS